jgi:hypothetical protein
VSLGRQWKQKSVLKITKEIADIVSYSKLRRQNATRNREDNDKSEAVQLSDLERTINNVPVILYY